MIKNLFKGDEGKFKIVEAGDMPYNLTYKLYKSRLTISDDEDNSISIDKRNGRIAIQRRGNVEWHRE